MDKFIPLDNEIQKNRAMLEEHYWGVCGAAVIAVLEKKTIDEILDAWIGEKGYKGYAPMKEMKLNLEKYGYKPIRFNGKKSKEFPEPNSEKAIVRIQWLKPDGTEYYWAAATPNTHYVLMQKLDGKWWIFCNSHLWFEKNSQAAIDYLKFGYVSSYFVI